MTTLSAKSAAAGSKFPPWLFCLLVLAFVIGTDDFVIAGVLLEIAKDLDVSVAAAGQLVTVFSVTYAISAPVMAVLTARLPRRPVMITGMLLFAATNVGAALAPNFSVLMVFRVLAAITASMMTPAAFSTAATLAPPEKMGRYMGTVATGLTVSLVIGVPVGTWLGGAFGWRSTMVFIVGLALLVAAGLALFMPTLHKAPPLTLKQRLSPLASRPVVSALAAMTAAAAGGLMAFIYIGPIADSLSGAGPTELGALISVIGIAGIAGATLGGRGADRWGPERTVVVALSVQTAATLVLALLSGVLTGKVSILLVGLILACWQMGGWALNSPIQMRLMKVAGNSGGEAIALNTSALYVGIGLAGVVGGAVLSGQGATGVLIASAAFGVVAMLLFLLSFRVGRNAVQKSGAAADASLVEE